VVDNDWAPPTHRLKYGDTAEILTSAEPLDVDPGLEDLCKTPKARTTINKLLQHKRRQYAQEIGQQILVQELRRHGLSADMIDRDDTHLILEFLNLKDISELFVRLGQDMLSPHLVLYYLEFPPQHREKAQQLPSDNLAEYERNTLNVPELDKAIHKFARCCNPYPGQEDVVAILSERGITFHHQECTDLHHRHDLQPQQLLDVYWDQKVPWKHPLMFHLLIFQETPVSLLTALAQLASDIHIQSLESTLDKSDQPVVRLVIQFKTYEDARNFFRCLPTDRIMIEDYWRQEAPKRLRSPYSER